MTDRVWVRRFHMQDTALTIRDKLITVIRAGMDRETEPVSLSAEDCEELIKIGTRQSILPIIYRGLKKAGAPEEVIKACEKARNRNAYRYLQQDAALKSISAAFDAEHIPYVLLKGAVLRHLYPANGMRMSCDIDVLVREEELEKAVQILEAQTDFRTLKRAYHDMSMVNSEVHLELHFSIKEHLENIDKLLSRAWEYAVPTGDGSRYTFTPELQIFHVVAHMSYHFLNGGLGIRPFLDLWLLRNKTQFEEETVLQMCSDCGILKFYEECCTLSQVWLENAEHSGLTAVLADYCLAGGVYGNPQFRVAGRQREKRGWSYILSRVFPPAYEVKEFYKDESGKQHALAYYYAKRLKSWFGKKRREDLKQQVSEILSSDQEYLDAVDELFKQLGL